MAITNINSTFIYTFIIIGLTLGIFILIASFNTIYKFISKQASVFKSNEPSTSSLDSIFTSSTTTMNDWFTDTTNKWDNSDYYINSIKWDTDNPPYTVAIIFYRLMNSIIFILNTIINIFILVATLITFAVSSPLHKVLPYIIAILIICLLFYPMYGMKIDCKGKTASGSCIEQFTTDNTTFADSENEILEQDEEDTPLITAIKNGDIKITDDDSDGLLTEDNAGEINSNGSTPLMWASRNGYLEIVNKIIELNGGDTINNQNNYGKTALIWATKYGHFEIVQTLINNDANVTLNDSDGKTARDYAQTQDVVLAIDIANENIKNSSRLEKPDDYTDPAWVNVQLQKIKQEVRFNILRENPELLGDEDALTEEVERVMLESQALEDTILQKAQNIQERNELTKEIKKNLVALGKETTLADMQRTDIQDLAAAYSSGEYTQDTNTRGALDRYDIQYHDTEETIKKEYAAQMLDERNIPYVKDGEENKLNRLFVQNQPHYSSSTSSPVLLLERIHPKNRKYENGIYVPDYENTILLSALRPKLKQ